MNLQPFRSSPFARPFLAVTLAATMLAFGCDRPDQGDPTANPSPVAQVGGGSEGGNAPVDDRGPQATTQQPPPGEALPGDTAPGAAPVAERTFTADQLEQLVAPVALYPDPLLMDVLMAATYPAEVAEAAAWKKDHANLNGKALDDAIDDKGWDVSVNALTHATQALDLMAADPEWTRDLGEAFLSQQDDVLNAVQVMRNRACDAGTLKTTEQQQVVFEEAPAQPAQPTPQYLVPPSPRIVRIVPARPEVLYVPVYNPRVIYGPPPPVVYYPRVWLYPAIHVGVAPIISFGVGLTIGGLFWGDADWHHHHVYTRRYDGGYYYDRRPWRERDYSHYEVWRHDTRHRRGVAYRRPYAGAETWSRDGRRDEGPRGGGHGGGREFTSPPDRPGDRGRPGGERAQREVSPRGPGGKGSPGSGQRRADKAVRPGAPGLGKPGAGNGHGPGAGGRPGSGRVEKPSKGGGRPSPGRVEKPSKGGGGRPPAGRVEKPSKGGGRPSSGRVEKPSRGGGGRPGGKDMGRPSEGRGGGSSKGRGGGGGGRGSAGKQGRDGQQEKGGKGKGGGR